MTPILYSFRRCPYAMRARMAIYKASIKCELREVVLKDKPESMLQLSKKGTVPVLLTNEKKVLDESLDVMYWALEQHDPEHWLIQNDLLTQELIEQNDNDFKYYLDRYKYHVGYPEHPQAYYRDEAKGFLEILEKCLNENSGIALTHNHISLSDISVFPFVRQFANVDLDWFSAAPYKLLKVWYKNIEQSNVFHNCMQKYQKWSPDQVPVYFPS